MRLAGLLIALFVVVVGVVGVITPETLIGVGRNILTPGGMYAIAALRIGLGLVLTLAARGSRAPKTLRVIGLVVVIAGIATPLIGADRSRALLEWEVAQGTAPIRVGAAIAVPLAGLLAFALAPRRRPA